MSDLIFRQQDFSKEFTPDSLINFKPIYRSLANNEGTSDPTFMESMISGLKYQWLPLTNRTVEYYNFSDV